MIPVELASLIVNERADEQIVYMREAIGDRRFPIVVGMFEAFAIDQIVKERTTERPLTHDLLLDVLRRLEGELARVEIDELRGDTYFAKLVVVGPDAEETRIDARPSDAITLALKAGAPIYAAEDVLKVAAEE